MIRLRVLGSLELCSDDGHELRAVLAQPKRAALLTYLAAATPAGFHRRDRLLALFWPGLDEARARDALSAALSFLRRELGRDAIAKRGSEEVGIDATTCWSDVAAFRAAMDGGRYEEALSHYRGDLLDGFFTDGAAPFQEWLERTRAQLRAAAARAARALAEQREHEASFTTAVSCARRAVELSGDDERVLRQLLELLGRLGDRAGAVAAYEAFERRLASELETEPAAETRALIERIRTRAVSDVARAPAPSAAPAAPATALQGWRIERELGRGGMATVYLAHDTVHDRHVALKVMRPELVLSTGVDLFLREITITARLAHPHILPLIDSGARDGVPYLVTPYVAGESLRARLARERTLPVGDALRIATEIAEALDYAHRSGVVHRDIKPENVLLADGHALVADFGVARALAASSTAVPPGVEGGGIVGSQPYMSPEQAAGGAPVDARTDLYSLGCVLFEMLTGDALNGDSAERRLARQPEVPAGVGQIVGDCVQAERERRPPSAADVLRRLEEVKTEGGATRLGSAAGRRARRLVIGSIAALTMVVLGYWVVRSRSDRDWRSVSAGRFAQLTNAPGMELDPALSPDGALLAYAAGDAGRMRIRVRPVLGGEAVEVSGDSMRQHRWPAWSPDGTQLAFLGAGGDRAGVEARLFVVEARGGTPRVVAERVSFFSTPAWSPDGRFIAYPLLDSIVVLDTRGGKPRVLSARPATRRSDALSRGSSMWAIHSLAWSADGRRVAFVSGNPYYVFGTTAFGNLGPSSIWTMALDGRPPVRLTTEPFTFGSPVFSPDGRAVLYVSNAGGAWDAHLQPIDGDGNPDGEPRRLLTGSNAYGISLSRDGSRLAYTSMNVRSNVFAAAIPPRGSVTPAAALRQLTDENQTVETVDVTPDGRWLVFESNRDGRARIYRMSVATGELLQLTHGPLEDFAPRWSPDGRRIAFHSREPSKDGLRDVYVMNADGSGRTRLTADSLDDSYPSWSPDGRRVLFSQVPGGTMASTLGADGRWGRAERDTVRGRWTRDGRSRVLQRRGELYVEGRGGAPRLLATARQLGGASVTLGVGPDPAAVYARAIDTAGVHSFYAVPLAGGPPRLLLRLDDSSRWMMRVIFAADSRNLYFTRTSAESDIWMVALDR